MTSAQRASRVKPLSVEPGQQAAFTAFRKSTSLESGKVLIAELAELTLREVGMLPRLKPGDSCGVQTPRRGRIR